MLSPHVRHLQRAYTPDLELEAKFGHYTHRGFNSTVPYVHFERLLNFLRLNVGSEKVEVSDVRQAGPIRQIITTPSGDGPERIEWQRKTSVIRHIELHEYDVRISMNREEELSPDEIPTSFQPTTTRYRTRHSFSMADGIVRVDMTRVMMTIQGKARNRFEVEIEFHGEKDQLSIFEEYIMIIFKLLRGTNLVFTTSDKHRLIQDVNSILGSAVPTMIDKSNLSEARNIKMRDLVYGGIVGNPTTNYMVTFKADGLRKMLVIHTTGIWMVYPPFEFNLVLDPSGIPENFLKIFNGSIFDGEWVQPKEPSEIAYWYLVFDCLAFQKNAAIQDRPYRDRRQVVDAVAKSIRTPTLTLDTKRTEEITSPEEFFQLVTDFLDRRLDLKYEQDGLMFFPSGFKYNPRAKEQVNPKTRKPYKLYERSLTRLPDICKWKDHVDITIDFALRWTPNGLRLYSYDADRKKMVQFTGSRYNPLTPDMIETDHELTRDQPTDLVVEYEWSNQKLRPRRIRYDKSGPNRLDVAMDDWDDIMNPILVEDIEGTSLKLTQAHFNRIKTKLYQQISKQHPNGANILDIGSGRGGDVAKWKLIQNGTIIAVEPNDENREILVRRIETNRLKDRVVIVPTTGQDTDTIVSTVKQTVGLVDAVTLMLSMSFFWESTSNVDALIDTIVSTLKPGGMVVFLTVDGDRVEQIFEDHGSDDMKIVTADLHLYPQPADPTQGRALDFVLPDTIMGNQREYLVRLQEFTDRLSDHGISAGKFYSANDEPLLTPENKLYASMYTYGYYNRSMENIKLTLPVAFPPPRSAHRIKIPPVGRSPLSRSGRSITRLPIPKRSES